ncbi:MAG: MBOAT family protein [Proteobacteria bacterium]|nr:MBOAT family protein [Pseudomonadota bacterium]
MLFTQLVFLFFFLGCFAIHWSLRGDSSRKFWLLACSYFFYGYWDYRFLTLIIISTVVDYCAGLALGSTENARNRKLLLILSLCVNLGLLGFFKYFNFFVSSCAELITSLGMQANDHTLKIVLPVGISFYTFQTMSYTIDVYRRKIGVHRDFLDFSMYVSFFPQLVAGPIVRASVFLPQLSIPRRFDQVDARRALLLFLVGYFKKTSIADNIATAIDPVFNNPAAYGTADLTLSGVLYSIQIYCDFSGYSDMAIATAAMFGYKLVKNFDAPYFSANVREFWRRWHISLSTWLRDYLYVSLGGNHGTRLRILTNLMLTMLLGGLWHGANWTFITWGFLHGLALIVHRLWRIAIERQRPAGFDADKPPATIGKISACTLTFIWVVFCFTIFRCPDIATAGAYFASLINLAPAAKVSLDWWLLIMLLGVGQWTFARYRKSLETWLDRVGDVPFYLAVGVACSLIPFFTPLNAAPFIYFQF